ncbi:MAG TPA: hypothetical protein VF173_00220 [Thermoanaerobaculia bacterium]|nr:hypothetical protein [Thermoanaerobaculia bacterium]
MKRLTLVLVALVLTVLAVAAPVLSLPPLCSCPSCAFNNNPCSQKQGTGYVVTTCGTYFGTFCTHPN